MSTTGYDEWLQSGDPGQREDPDAAWNRKETDPCERNTVGCSIKHTPENFERGCETW